MNALLTTHLDVALKGALALDLGFSVVLFMR